MFHVMVDAPSKHTAIIFNQLRPNWLTTIPSRELKIDCASPTIRRYIQTKYSTGLFSDSS